MKLIKLTNSELSVKVSDIDFSILNKFKWFISNGYAKNTNKGLMHRYIFIHIKCNNLSSKDIIDHIDNNRLNNMRSNIRQASNGENSRNRKKKKNCSSNYIGVTKQRTRWAVQISIDHKKYKVTYKQEVHAAYQYNLWLIDYKLKGKKNIIDPNLLVDFILHKKCDKKYDSNSNILPKCIVFNRGKYELKINIEKIQTLIGRYDTLELAIEKKGSMLKTLEDKKNKVI